VSLTVELEQIAAAASEHGDVTGVLAAEPTPGRRRYLVSLGDDEARRWLAFDDEARPLERRESVRETASIVARCELATEEAALALERAIGAPPRVASPAYLDEVGAATRGLERALGELASPFTNAMRSGTGAVDEFVREVESRYVFSLRDSA
jgi:hypothetical protein